MFYPQLPIFLPPGHMSETQVERARSKNLSYWVWGASRRLSAIQNLPMLSLKGPAAWFSWQKLSSCSIPPTASPHKKRLFQWKGMCCFSEEPFHMDSTNNSFCQITQCIQNRPTISALEETYRTGQTKWNKQGPFPQISEEAPVPLLNSV